MAFYYTENIAYQIYSNNAFTFDAFISSGLHKNKQLDDTYKLAYKEYIPQLIRFCSSIYRIQYGRPCFVHQFFTSFFAIRPVSTGKS
jgi:hypothetical protein